MRQHDIAIQKSLNIACQIQHRICWDDHWEAALADAGGATGQPARVTSQHRDRWTVETGGAAQVNVRYRLYAREASVRGNFVDGDMAVLNGAPTFMTLVEEQRRPWRIQVELPEGWEQELWFF